MMKRDECFRILARHLTNEIVIAVYSSAFDWLPPAARAQLLFVRRHGDRVVARAWPRARATAAARHRARWRRQPADESRRPGDHRGGGAEESHPFRLPERNL